MEEMEKRAEELAKQARKNGRIANAKMNATLA